MSDRTILILSANPQSTTQLQLDREVRDIDEGLRRSALRDRFRLEQKWAVRPRDLRRALLDVEPNIVHFCGHGDGEAGLVLESDSEPDALVDAEGLGSLFALFSDAVECVVLNACYSEIQARAIAKAIPVVVGMEQSVGDRAAQTFAVAFYDALGAGRPYPFAFEFGRVALQQEYRDEANNPQLLVREGYVETAATMEEASSVRKGSATQAMRRKALERNLAELMEEYEALMAHAGRALNSADRLRLQRDADDVARRAEEVEKQLNALG